MYSEIIYSNIQAKTTCTQDSDCECFCKCGSSGYTFLCGNPTPPSECSYCIMTEEIPESVQGAPGYCRYDCNFTGSIPDPNCDGSACIGTDCFNCGPGGSSHGKCCNNTCISSAAPCV